MVLHIAIIGGGIGGLTLALTLSRLHLDDLVEVDIYEAASELTQVGAGITFWPRPWKILGKLGLENALASQLAPGAHIPNGQPRVAFQFRKSDHAEGAPIRDLIISGAALSFHRFKVQEVLLKELSPLFRCHLSSRLVSYEIRSDSKVIDLVFENGKKATCDLLIGADGLKSSVRKLFVAKNTLAGQVSAISDPIWTGTYAYRSMIESKLIKAELPNHSALTTPIIYCGKNKHLIAYPILQGRVINITAYVSDLEKEGSPYTGPPFRDVTNEEVLPLFSSWEEEVRVLVQNMEKPSRWAIHAIEQLGSYATGPVALLGDAAHAMTPHQGNGAGTAIEDAYVLAHLISNAVREKITISEVTKVYDAIRRPFANSIHSASRVHGLLYEFNAPGFEDVQEGQVIATERLTGLGESIVGDWEYAWLTTVDDDLEKAVKILSDKKSVV